MRDTVRPISDKMLRELVARAHRLTSTIESATRGANDATVRREGARFGEVIEEWLDDIKALVESHDAGAAERMESFETRLAMAERKVDNWKLPPLPAAPAPRKRAAKQAPPMDLEAEVEATSPWYTDDLDDMPMTPIADAPAASSARKGVKKGRAA
jgi:hypothetical protein